MKKLNIGIVGAGRIGNVHAESITYHIPEAQVAMVTDVIEESAKKLAERFGIPKYSSNYMDIINDPAIDAVLVCSPTPTHADITIAALKAGKHVFCEKPVHTSIEKIKEVAKVAEETGKKLQIGFNRRFDHNHRHVQQLAQNGTLGNIEIIKITSRDPEPPSPEYAAYPPDWCPWRILLSHRSPPGTSPYRSHGSSCRYTARRRKRRIRETAARDRGK